MNANWVIDKPKKRWQDPIVEPLLWNYPQYKLNAEIDELEKREILPSCTPNYSPVPGGTDISDTTSKYGIKRAEQQLSLDEADCLKIETIFKHLRPDLQKLCEMYYWEKLRPPEIKSKLNICYRTLWNWKYELLYIFAQNLHK